MIAETPQPQALEKEKRDSSERSFVRILAFLSAGLAAFPDILNWALRPIGSTYLGIQYNLDDHMVYAAWMRQAMDGRFLFDNRFTTDSQPGLTVHLYFLVLGWIAKVLGIALTMALARIFLSAAFVFLLYRLVRRICPDIYTTKLAMALVVVGGGIGSLVWRDFGQAINPPINSLMHNIMLGLLPTDVWQPEGYVLPSMLTNGLFMVSLCLIVICFLSFLSAKQDWRWVPQGALAMFLLMNIHSYDVLIIAFSMVGVLAAAIVQKQLTMGWLARALVIGAGAVPSALWFLYVLQRDPVFQARAATPTYTANFRQVVFGYLGLMVLGLVALAARPGTDKRKNLIRIGGASVAAILFIAMFVAASTQPGTDYFMGLGVWVACVGIALVAIALVSDANPAWNLAASWALLGTIGPYFPALFQRKLSMGLAVPWAILAALAVGVITRKLDRGTRNLALVLAICALGATSIRWFGREVELGKLNVSNTSTHPIYLGIDATQIIKQLNDRKGRTVVIAMPGTPLPDSQNPGTFLSPYLPDYNPILSGLAGVYTYAGHWSETPEYLRRRSEEYAFFMKGVTDDQRRQFLQYTQADYVIAPVPQTFPALSLDDVSNLGEVVYRGQQFSLVRVR